MKSAYESYNIPDRPRLRMMSLEDLVRTAERQLSQMPSDMRTPEVFCAVVNYLLPRRWLCEHDTDIEFIIGRGTIEVLPLVLTEFEAGPEGDPTEVYPYPLHVIVECKQTGDGNKPSLWIHKNRIIIPYQQKPMELLLATAIEQHEKLWGEKKTVPAIMGTDSKVQKYR